MTTNCSTLAVASGTALLYEANASTLAQLGANRIGNAHNACNSGAATINEHAPVLDDASYNGSPGFVYVCGTNNITNGSTAVALVLYSFSFPAGGGAIGTSPTNTATPTAASSSDECSPMTYFTSNTTSKIFRHW